MDCLRAGCGICCQSRSVVERQHAHWKERSSRSCLRQAVFRRASPLRAVWPGKDCSLGAGAWRGGGFCKAGESSRTRNGQLFVADQHTASVISAQSLEQAEDFTHRGEGEDALVDAPSVTVEKVGKNKRRIAATISIGAPLATVWGILTDYDRLSDFIPGLAVSELLEKGEDRALIRQVGQQDLAFGIVFKAEAVMEVTEHPLEIRNGARRDLDFQMVKGDFELFAGTWSMEEDRCAAPTTVLSYVVEVQPKVWLPVALLEARLSNDIKLNLTCIRDAAVA